MVDLGDTTFNVTFDTVVCARSDIVVEWNGGTHSTMPSWGSWNGGPSTVGVLAHRNLAVVHAEPLEGCTELTNGDAAGKIVVVERSPLIFSCAVGQQIKGKYYGSPGPTSNSCQRWLPKNGGGGGGGGGKEWTTRWVSDQWANNGVCDEADSVALAKQDSSKCRPGTDAHDCNWPANGQWYEATVASIDAGGRTITVNWDDCVDQADDTCLGNEQGGWDDGTCAHASGWCTATYWGAEARRCCPCTCHSDDSYTNVYNPEQIAGRILSYNNAKDLAWSSCLIRASDLLTRHYSMIN
jgi:hypothetical protein